MRYRPQGMRTGLTISCAGHAAILAWSVLTFVVRPYEAGSSQAMPIDIVSTSQFDQMTGAKNAPQAEKPKPIVEKVGDPSQVDDLTAKLAKKEVKATTEVASPQPKPPEPKAKKPPQPPAPAIDQIADVLKKEDVKPEPKKPEPKPPTPPKKPAQQEAPAFDPRKVALLLNKQESQRVASATDRELNRTPSRTDATGGGGPTSGGNNPNGLSDAEKGALRQRLRELWNAPPSVTGNKDLSIDVSFHLRPDGTLDGAPVVETQGSGPLFAVASDAAKRAVLQAAPYKMLLPEHYEAWRDLQVTFDPVSMGLQHL